MSISIAEEMGIFKQESYQLVFVPSLLMEAELYLKKRRDKWIRCLALPLFLFL